MHISAVNTEKLLADTHTIFADYDNFIAQRLALDLTRGKPSAEQLDFSHALLSLPGDNYMASGGVDTRNYGGIHGIDDIRQLWSTIINIPADNIIAGDSSSLNIMFDLISWSYTFGNNDSARPWSAEEKPKWICPVPGYDRHHSITELFGFDMLTVPMTPDGPDMQRVCEYARDPAVKGMWCVPVFSNPEGITYSDTTIRQLVHMPTGAPDFRIVWDNAYAVHTLSDDFPPLANVIDIAQHAGNPNRFWVMTSTSKITHAGSGVAFFASSRDNLDWYARIAAIRGIGPNKINQLAHYQFFSQKHSVHSVMKKHAEILAPKFDCVTRILQSRLADYGVARWTQPKGGYFISVELVDTTASRVVELAKKAGVILTPAGSTFPLRHDPYDNNVRLAPSVPSLEELETAIHGFASCVLYATRELLPDSARR